MVLFLLRPIGSTITLAFGIEAFPPSPRHPPYHGANEAGFCLPLPVLYNPRMAFDPANPPIWLRKLHVTAAQISPTDYPSTPEEGILLCCRLSDAMWKWSRACAQALGHPPLPPSPPFENPFRPTRPAEPLSSDSGTADAAR